MHRKPSGRSAIGAKLMPGQRRDVDEVAFGKFVDAIADQAPSLATMYDDRVRVFMALERGMATGATSK